MASESRSANRTLWKADMKLLLFFSTFRSPRQSLPIILTAFFCSTLMYVGISWIDGIHTSLSQSTQILYGKTRIIAQDFRKREALYPIASNITPLIKHPSITPKITFLAQLESSTQENRPVLGFPISYIEQRIKPLGTLEGTLPNERQGILLGASLAEVLDISIQDSLIITTQTQDMSPSAQRYTVSGIITTYNTFFDQVAYISIEDAQWMTDMEGATELITDIDKEQIIPIAKKWSKENNYPVHVHTWLEKEPYASIRSITDTINLGLLLFILSCSTLTIFNLSVINMRRVQHELGILRSMGASKITIAFSYTSTNIILVCMGMTAGLLFAQLALQTILAQGFPLGESLSEASYTLPMAEQIYPQPSTKGILMVVALIVLSGLIGSILPCIHALRKDPMKIIKDNLL